MYVLFVPSPLEVELLLEGLLILLIATCNNLKENLLVGNT